jgi:FtsP/CotA-like multicopper oxidase with cupredoxin domain
MKPEDAMPHHPAESARDDIPANLSGHVTDRRQFLRWGAFATAGAVSSQLPACAVGGTLDTLREPMSLSSSNGVVSLDLVADYVSERIPLALAPNAGTFPAASTMVDTMLRRYAGSLPAPTLRCKAGDTIRIRLINRLPPSPKGQSKLSFLNFQNGTNLHFHGLHVSPEKVGELYGDYVVDSWDAGVMPGQQRQHEVLVPKGHPPGTFWYHPHLHGSSGGQVASGMFGAILIEDAASSPFDPSVNRERVIFVHKYNLNGAGRTDSFYDSAVTPPSAFFLNGSFQPTIVMRPGEVQVWHFINSATFYAFNPVLDGHTLLAYARDGDPIPEGYRSINAETVKDFNAQNWPLNIQKWPGTFASPGSRISVFVKASDKPGDYLLRSAQSPWTTNPNLPQYDEVVARVRVEGDPLPHSIPSAPNTLLSRFSCFLPITDQELASKGGTTRNLVLGVVPLSDARIPKTIPQGEEWSVPTGDGADGFAGVVFAAGDMAGMAPFQSSLMKTQTVKLGDVEEWTVSSTDSYPHPFHIHVNDSYVVKVNGEKLAQPYWADTLAIPPRGSITFRIRFEDFKGKFVWHCHALDHEDLGMMQLVEVVA